MSSDVSKRSYIGNIFALIGYGFSSIFDRVFRGISGLFRSADTFEVVSDHKDEKIQIDDSNETPGGSHDKWDIKALYKSPTDLSVRDRAWPFIELSQLRNFASRSKQTKTC